MEELLNCYMCSEEHNEILMPQLQISGKRARGNIALDREKPAEVGPAFYRVSCSGCFLLSGGSWHRPGGSPSWLGNVWGFLPWPHWEVWSDLLGAQ